MLGENHSLICEFPSFSKAINTLNETDESFKSKVKKYDDLDEKIRHLELNNSPTDDANMHQMKQVRAKLKDELYQCLLSSGLGKN